MSDDLTQKLPGDNEPIAPQDDDRISVLIIAVQSLSTSLQSLSTNFQLLSADFQEVKVRLEALEKTVNARSLETKPIWERALAEIAETRAELAETRAELAETRAELKAELAETRVELKGELAETRTELKAELAETRAELRAEMKDGFRKLGLKIELLNEDSLTLRGDQKQLDRRVETLESKTP
jgi:ribosomal protein L29